MWLLRRLRPLCALGLEASPGASCGVRRALALGRRRTCQTDPSKGPRPGELIPSLPSIFFFCFSSLVPFLRLSGSPLHLFLLPPQVPLLFSPSSRLSPPPPFLVQAFLGGARRLRVESAQREFRESRAGLRRIALSAGRPRSGSGRPRGPRGRRGRAGQTGLAGPAERAPEGRRGGSLSEPGAGQPRSEGSSEPQ